MRGADIASDHQLIRTQIKLKLKKKTRIRYNANKLQDKATRSAFKLELSNRFAVLEAIDEEPDINTRWNQFSKAYNNTAEKVLGRKKRNNKPWISAKSWAKLHLKNMVGNARSERIQQQLRVKYMAKDKEVKSNIKADKRRWLDDLMDDAQKAADNGNMKTLAYMISPRTSAMISHTVLPQSKIRRITP